MKRCCGCKDERQGQLYQELERLNQKPGELDQKQNQLNKF